MSIRVAILLLLKEWLAGPIRYLRAIWRYPHVTFHPGVAVGPGCQFGKNVTVYRNTVLAHCAVGDYSYVGGDCTLKNCSLGRFCSLGKEVQIGLGLHPTYMISTYPGFYSKLASGVKHFASLTDFVESKSVSIGNDVWIGNNSIILDGVNVGDGVVIAAGSVVTRSVPPYAIVGGVPAKIIRMRFPDDKVRFLLDFRWWDRDESFIKEYAALFAQPDRFFETFKDLI